MTQLGIVTYNIAKDWDLPTILSLLGQRNICPGRLHLAEIPESTDPERVLRYFKALWLSYQPGAASR